ncbi:MAG: MFS transporter, partial [Planctomycetota bacterium]|nr:MFS transporter [Planctomycetota bacterium]
MTRNTLAWLRGAINVEASDVPNLFWSFLWFFFVLAAFYTVRPMRETYATRVGDVQQLFLATFICMLLASPVYNALLDRVSRAKLIPIAYRFFSLWLIGFAIASIVFPEPPFAFCAIFFVWVSVFNLFVVTIFWSVLSDRYSSAQGKKFFGAIAAGGSLGALAASLLVSNFDSRSGNWLLLLLTVVLLELAIWCAYRLEQSPTTFETGDTPVALLEQDQPDQVAMEPGILSSFVSVFQSPYLLGIVGFLLLGKWCATSVYLEQVDMVKQQVSDAAERQQMFARENWLVQIGTLIFQLGLTRPLIR